MPHVNNFGITESLKVADILGTTITAAANVDSNQDGNIATLEILNGVQVAAFKVLSRTPNLTDLRQEAMDYTEAEKAEIVAEVAKVTEMPTAKVEALVERGFGIILDILDFALDTQRPAEDFETPQA